MFLHLRCEFVSIPHHPWQQSKTNQCWKTEIRKTVGPLTWQGVWGSCYMQHRTLWDWFRAKLFFDKPEDWGQDDWTIVNSRVKFLTLFHIFTPILNITQVILNCGWCWMQPKWLVVITLHSHLIPDLLALPVGACEGWYLSYLFKCAWMLST